MKKCHEIRETRGWTDPLRWLPSPVLRDRGMKAWRKAQKFNPRALFIDYDWVMANRPPTCPICGQGMEDENRLAITHRESLESGGPHTEENLQVIHTECHRKTANTPLRIPQDLDAHIKQYLGGMKEDI